MWLWSIRRDANDLSLRKSAEATVWTGFMGGTKLTTKIRITQTQQNIVKCSQSWVAAWMDCRYSSKKWPSSFCGRARQR